MKFVLRSILAVAISATVIQEYDFAPAEKSLTPEAVMPGAVMPGAVGDSSIELVSPTGVSDNSSSDEDLLFKLQEGLAEVRQIREAKAQGSVQIEKELEQIADDTDRTLSEQESAQTEADLELSRLNKRILTIQLGASEAWNSMGLLQQMIEKHSAEIAGFKTKVEILDVEIKGKKTQRESLQSQISARKTDIDKLNVNLATLRGTVDGLKSQITQSETRIKELNSLIPQIEAEIVELKKEWDALVSSGGGGAHPSYIIQRANSLGSGISKLNPAHWRF